MGHLAVVETLSTLGAGKKTYLAGPRKWIPQPQTYVSAVLTNTAWLSAGATQPEKTNFLTLLSSNGSESLAMAKCAHGQLR